MSTGRDAVIVGAANTRQARRLDGETSATITLAAIVAALGDAGLERSDIDGLNILPGLDHLNGSRTFGYALGVPYFWVGRAAPGPAAVIEAARAIESGMCDVVVIASGQAGVHTDRGSVAPWTRPPNEFIECWGLHTPAEFALSAQEYYVRYDVDPAKVAHVAAVIRNNGARNPEAVYYGRGPFTADDILSSRMIASPYHLLECSTTAEGGSALVMTTSERAADLPAQPIHVLGGASESWGPSYMHPPTYDRVGMLGRRAGDRAFAEAGIARSDVDVFELYDNFSWEIIRQFEALRYCEVGEGPDFVAGDAIEVGGRYPIVTDGGTMAHSHTGESQRIQRVVQAVRQLRGTASANAVEHARIALVAQLGDIALLGKDR
jgi:acetyl-CoA acetyltransferase